MNSQGDSAVPPQAGSLQAESTGSQAASISPPQTGSSQTDSTDAQAASISLQAVCTISQRDSTAPKAGSTQAANTNSHGDSAVPPQEGSSWVETPDAKAASTSSQAVSTNS